MPNYTKTINLEKPLQTEIYDVDKRNANWDKIDAAIKKDRDDADTHAADSDAHANGIAGNAASATKLKTARKITLGGDIRTIGRTFDGSGDIEFGDIQVINAKQADEATKAVNDTNGNRIDTTYGPVGYTLEEAYKNGTIDNALNIDISHDMSTLHKPHIVTESETTINCPPDLVFGVREVCFIRPNEIIVRITGLDKNKQANCIWTNIYNHGDWTGWQKYLTSYIGGKLVRYVIDVGGDSNMGWRCWSDGWKEVWGVVGHPADGHTHTITGLFPIPFLTRPVHVSLTASVSAADATNYSVALSAVTTNTMIVINTASDRGPSTYYKAEGF